MCGAGSYSASRSSASLSAAPAARASAIASVPLRHMAPSAEAMMIITVHTP